MYIDKALTSGIAAKEISVEFSKRVRLKDYEFEEFRTSYKIQPCAELTGGEIMVSSTLASGIAEIQVMCSLLKQGKVSVEEVTERRIALESAMKMAVEATKREDRTFDYDRLMIKLGSGGLPAGK